MMKLVVSTTKEELGLLMTKSDSEITAEEEA